MWKRSEVERLTGLGRHTIQDLCNQNTSRAGLGFWEPAVMKPGYSRFDEGDLLAFYLVRQLIKVGFTPAEVGPVILSMTEKNHEFVSSLRKRAHDLNARRVAIDEKLASLERLEEAAVASAPERCLYAMMERELAVSVNRVVGAAARELCAPDDLRERARTSLQEIADSLMRLIRGEDLDPCLDEIEAYLAQPCEKRESQGQVLLARATALFLSEVENGVPVELALGKGSFARLRRLASVLERATDQ